MRACKLTEIKEIIHDEFGSGRFIIDNIEIYNESILTFGRIGHQKMVVKIFEACSDNALFEDVYRYLHSSPFPEYVRFGQQHYKNVIVNAKKCCLVAYPYIPSCDCFCLSKQNIKDVVCSLWQIHKIRKPQSVSIVIKKFISGQELYYADYVLKSLNNIALTNLYNSNGFLTGANLLHGDFRLANILNGGKHVIDLEDALWGPPEYDLGRLLQSSFWETKADYRLWQSLLTEYEEVSGMKINRFSVVCSAILRFSHRMNADGVHLEDLRIGIFINKLREIL